MESVQYFLLNKRMVLTHKTNTSKEVAASECYILALKTKVVYLLGLYFAG